MVGKRKQPEVTILSMLHCSRRGVQWERFDSGQDPEVICDVMAESVVEPVTSLGDRATQPRSFEVA